MKCPGSVEVQRALEQRKDGLWRIASVPYQIREVPPSFKNRFGEVFREYGKLAFDKDTARPSRE